MSAAAPPSAAERFRRSCTSCRRRLRWNTTRRSICGWLVGKARSIPTNIPPAWTRRSRGSRSLLRARLMGAAIASMKRLSRRSPTRVKRWMKSSRSWPMQGRSLPTRSRSWKTRIRRMRTALFLWPTQSRRRSRNWPTHTRSWWMGSGRSRKMNRSWPMANRSWQTAKKSWPTRSRPMRKTPPNLKKKRNRPRTR